jgi:hypothetical protein
MKARVDLTEKEAVRASADSRLLTVRNPFEQKSR